MAFSVADFVRETTTTTGTGTYSLAGAVAGFQGFIAGNATGSTVRYSVTNGTDWQVCEGVVTDASPDTLTRGTVLDSSNAGAAVNWGAGTKTVSQVWTADEAKQASGGATATSGSADITLTSSSNQVQKVTMTASVKSVILPDATTLQNGRTFYIYNEGGTYPFAVRMNGNGLLCGMPCKAGGVIQLVDNGTSAGTWKWGSVGYNDFDPQAGFIGVGQGTTDLFTVNNQNTTWLDSTTLLCVYDEGGSLKAVAGTLSGFGITFGSPVTISAVATNNSPGIGILSATAAIVVYSDVTNTDITSVVLTLSGTVITVNALADILTTDYANHVKVVALSSTQAICAYSTVTADDIYVAVLDISGTTITPATPVLVAAGTYNNGILLASYSSSKVLVADAETASCWVVDISGSVATPGSVQTTTVPIYSLANIDSSTIAAVGEILTILDLAVSTLAVSGTTVTETVSIVNAGPTTFSVDGVQPGYPNQIVKLSSSKFAVFVTTDPSFQDRYAVIYTLSGTAFSYNSSVKLDAPNHIYHNNSPFSENAASATKLSLTYYSSAALTETAIRVLEIPA